MGLIVMNLGSPFFSGPASVTRCMKARAICVLMKTKRQYSKASIIGPMAVSTLHAMEKAPLIQRINLLLERRQMSPRNKVKVDLDVLLVVLGQHGLIYSEIISRFAE